MSRIIPQLARYAAPIKNKLRHNNQQLFTTNISNNLHLIPSTCSTRFHYNNIPLMRHVPFQYISRRGFAIPPQKNSTTTPPRLFPSPSKTVEKRKVVNKGAFITPEQLAARTARRRFFKRLLILTLLSPFAWVAYTYYRYRQNVAIHNLPHKDVLTYDDFTNVDTFNNIIRQNELNPMFFEIGSPQQVFPCPITASPPPADQPDPNYKAYHKFIVKHLSIAQYLETRAKETIEYLESTALPFYKKSTKFNQPLLVFDVEQNHVTNITPSDIFYHHMNKLKLIHDEMAEFGPDKMWYYLHPFDTTLQRLCDTRVQEVYPGLHDVELIKQHLGQSDDDNIAQISTALRNILTTDAAKLYYYNILLKMRINLMLNQMLWIQTIVHGDNIDHKQLGFRQIGEDIYLQANPERFKAQFEHLAIPEPLPVANTKGTGFVQQYTSPLDDSKEKKVGLIHPEQIQPFAQHFPNVFYQFGHLFGSYYDEQIENTQPVVLKHAGIVPDDANIMSLSQFVGEHTFYALLEILNDPQKTYEEQQYEKLNDNDDNNNNTSQSNNVDQQDEDKVILLASQCITPEEMQHFEIPKLNQIIDVSKLPPPSTLPPPVTMPLQGRPVMSTATQELFQEEHIGYVPIAFLFYAPISPLPSISLSSIPSLQRKHYDVDEDKDNDSNNIDDKDINIQK